MVLLRQTVSMVHRGSVHEREPIDQPTEEGALAWRVCEGSRDAEAELCALLAPRIRLFGHRHLRDEQATLELVQRVLLIVVEKLRARELRAPDRVASFTLGCARRVVSELRRERATVPFDEARHGEAVTAPPRDPLAIQRVAAAVAALDDRARSVLVMTYYGERSTAEIAAVLGLQPGHVRVIRHRALHELRDRLEGT